VNRALPASKAKIECVAVYSMLSREADSLPAVGDAMQNRLCIWPLTLAMSAQSNSFLNQKSGLEFAMLVVTLPGNQAVVERQNH